MNASGPGSSVSVFTISFLFYFIQVLYLLYALYITKTKSQPSLSFAHLWRTKDRCSCSKAGCLLGLVYSRRRSSSFWRSSSWRMQLIGRDPKGSHLCRNCRANLTSGRWRKGVFFFNQPVVVIRFFSHQLVGNTLLSSTSLMSLLIFSFLSKNHWRYFAEVDSFVDRTPCVCCCKNIHKLLVYYSAYTFSRTIHGKNNSEDRAVVVHKRE